MELTTNVNDWEWVGDAYDKAFATTSDPRVVVLIERERYYDDPIDGDAYAPAFHFDAGHAAVAASTFMDDASVDIADRYLAARAYFVNRHYRKGGRQMDYNTASERYLRIFHDTTVIDITSSIDRNAGVTLLNTPTWRAHVGLDTLQAGEKAIADDAEEWQHALDGDVFGIGYAVNADRLTDDEEIDLLDGSWEEAIDCWGLLGEDYAKSEAAVFAYGAPNLQPLDAPRMYRVSYTIDLEADSPEDAAWTLVALLSKPDTASRGSYDVRALDGTKVTTIDLGEDEF